jgi:hypothetical protein
MVDFLLGIEPLLLFDAYPFPILLVIVRSRPPERLRTALYGKLKNAT